MLNIYSWSSWAQHHRSSPRLWVAGGGYQASSLLISHQPLPFSTSEALLDPQLLLGLLVSAAGLAELRVLVVRHVGTRAAHDAVAALAGRLVGARSRPALHLHLRAAPAEVHRRRVLERAGGSAPDSGGRGTNDTSRRLNSAPESQRDQTLRQQGPLASPVPSGHPAVPTKPAGPWRDCAEARQAGHGRSGVYELRVGRHTGFGQPDGEYWLGLEPVHQLTSHGDHELLMLETLYPGTMTSLSAPWIGTETPILVKSPYSGGNCALYQRGGWWYHACAHSNLNGVWHRGGHYRSRYQDGVYWAEFRGGAYSLKKAAMLIRPLRL
ncbi:hypothetical protein E2I00_009503 [Balaenoptera physalus]|uniref:Fibrinogen C-terminal domain-containing protein n=1 Tax=Balaenoptera physalus TaxID=9770 RepID=A0A643CKU4_BALPH|nr:hypothetical protein E2I00_009503 [Balaenoptera physalus]